MAAPVIPNIGPNTVLTLGGTELFYFEAGSQDLQRITAANIKAYVLLLPTSDPHVNGQLWNNAGTPTISSG